MSDTLRRRLRSHREYTPNPMVSEFIKKIDKDIDVTVRERRPSGKTQTKGTGRESRPERGTWPESIRNLARSWYRWLTSTDEPANSDAHDQCLTPVADDLGNGYCIMCYDPAVNPFRCTEKGERLDPNNNGYDREYTQRYHICCYQCLGKNMEKLDRDRFDCPYADAHVFDLNGLIPANNATVRETENHMFYCKNNCGFMGNPLAHAHHICPRSEITDIGHTSRSNVVLCLQLEVSGLNRENFKLRADLRHVLRNYNIRQKYCKEITAKHNVLNNWYQGQFPKLGRLTKNIRAFIDHFKQLLYDLDGMADEFVDADGLEVMERQYKQRIEDLIEENDRVMTELDNIPLVPESALPQLKDASTQTDAKCIESGQSFSLYTLVNEYVAQPYRPFEEEDQTDGSTDAQN